MRGQVLGRIPYFEGNGRSFWYTRVRHLFFGCVYNNDPDIEGKGGGGGGRLDLVVYTSRNNKVRHAEAHGGMDRPDRHMQISTKH